LRPSSWVKIRLHTKNQLPRLSRTALIVIIPGVVVWNELPLITDELPLIADELPLITAELPLISDELPLISFRTDYKTTPTKVVLSCFGFLVGLWQ
jgi:hypothetical protein